MLSFRVRQPAKNCLIEIWQDGAVIYTVRKKKVIPAEMVTITLPRACVLSTNNIKVVARSE